ncbi:hypothetical protein EVAR_95819_1 [Eumeta japonica]|uniref:Protein kinase domain-containing protein n=1 Tax=Eumeta variegata TaxID=151549 RepID=A0A4C1W511_EUMVA|nr:hypothetical protein EVAR_95819_1 [Eumeta japonica]
MTYDKRVRDIMAWSGGKCSFEPRSVVSGSARVRVCGVPRSVSRAAAVKPRASVPARSSSYPAVCTPSPHTVSAPRVSGLEDNDFGNRVRFCRFLLHADVDDPDFLKSILWTDESKFTKQGILNLHNLHHWSSKDENPRVKRQRSFQRRFSLNVWAGVIGDRVIGPHYLPDNLNGDNYLEFLQNVLPEMIVEVSNFNENRPIIFQNDGCPAHWRLIVRKYLNNVFPNSWIGRDGPIPWPLRAPDLTPLDFYVWGQAKELVYATEVQNVEDLRERIEAAFQKIQQEMLLSTSTVEIRLRCRAYIANGGKMANGGIFAAWSAKIFSHRSAVEVLKMRWRLQAVRQPMRSGDGCRCRIRGGLAGCPVSNDAVIRTETYPAHINDSWIRQLYLCINHYDKYYEKSWFSMYTRRDRRRALILESLTTPRGHCRARTQPSLVRLLVHARTGESVALKMLRAENNEDTATAAREAALHRALRHPHVLRCLGERRHQTAHYMFLEYAQGGELFDRIEPDVGMAEGAARRYWRQVLSGIGYLHSRGVAHRDLKPENLLLDANDQIKISDFGMATLFKHGGAERRLARRCGTLPYAAPEVLLAAEKPYRAQPADLWSCGVVLVAMLAGELPWEQASDSSSSYTTWINGSNTGRPWYKLSPRVLSLLRRLLIADPQRRLTHEQILRHPWTVDEQQPKCPLTIERGWCSQPARAPESTEAVDTADCGEAIFSYSQPAAIDDLLLGTQSLQNTQTGSSHQSVLQRLVRRMTRVWVRLDEAAALDELCEVLRRTPYTWRRDHAHTVVIECGERVRMRAWAVRAASGARGETRVLLDFRRSRGCGLEFKRRFVELRDALRHVAAPPPPDPRVDLLAPAMPRSDSAMDQS